jgi:uncharacterized protein
MYYKGRVSEMAAKAKGKGKAKKVAPKKAVKKAFKPKKIIKAASKKAKAVKKAVTKKAKVVFKKTALKQIKKIARPMKAAVKKAARPKTDLPMVIPPKAPVISLEEKNRGKVRVENYRFKFEGNFHYPSLNSPIYDEHGKLVGVTNPRDITHVHMYGGEAIFFESLGKGKLIASRCDNPDCETKGSIYMPFRIHCPDCLAKNTPVDITEKANKTAKVYTFMICERSGAFNVLPKPIKFINIEFAGVVTILMSYLCKGTPKFGMRVVPIFNTKKPTCTILDMSWVPEGTKADELPENFTFSK